ncbi:MAG: N-6 DNA methylase, partial [Eubacteriales bacterium]|nr:N-6 DNA methylase [Eubacteriales bacterium]
MMTLMELCKEISISLATGKNWVRLGKITPLRIENGEPVFTGNYVAQLKADIQSGASGALKSRRNKKYVSGNYLYHSYVSESCKNAAAVGVLIEKLQECADDYDEKLLSVSVADCAVKLLYQRSQIYAGADMERQPCTDANALCSFLEGAITFGGYDGYIWDLIVDKEYARYCILKYPQLFTNKYIYEEKEDVLGLIYISGQSVGNRKKAGSYYTPTDVVRKAINRLVNVQQDSLQVIDPCCGTGNFLLQLPKHFSINDIYGNDIDALSIKIARINMLLKFYGCDENIIRNHIYVKDNLLCEGEKHIIVEREDKYDYVIGNPPWGYEFSQEQKVQLQKIYSLAAGGDFESYDLFLERALSKLKPEGVMSFILPEAVLNVKSHRLI